MKYSVNYQYLEKPRGRPGDGRPNDDGRAVEIDTTDKGGFALLPNVGDYVSIDGMGTGPRFSGKVKSRLFNYISTTDEVFCHVNIVVEETDDDWGALIKE
jgi:hypothetical protein